MSNVSLFDALRIDLEEILERAKSGLSISADFGNIKVALYALSHHLSAEERKQIEDLVDEILDL